MEELARKYLTDIKIENGYLNGYTEDELKKTALLQDIDSISGGFVKRYTKEKKRKKTDEGTSEG